MQTKGNYDKYMKANISFTSLAKGWKGYTDEVNGEQKLINKLIEQGYDLNDDGEISADELAAISESVDLSNCRTDRRFLIKRADRQSNQTGSFRKPDHQPAGRTAGSYDCSYQLLCRF